MFQRATQHSVAGKILPANYGLATLLYQVLIVTEESAIDLGNYLRLEQLTVPCLLPLTEVLN
jgi:hypothetical protein